MIDEKVNNTSLFSCLTHDPRQELYNDMINIWKEGKANRFVTEKECSEVVGITENNNKSTSSIFKPGTTYFCPSLKIHKLQEKDITPGCKPPARIVSCLQEGVTKYSDVFLANKWLKELESDYCKDLVKDTIDTLKWLDDVNTSCSREFKLNLKPFTFDFESLYDSLSPELVIKSLRHAINKCRHNWSPDFTEWLLSNVSLSMKSAIGTHKGKWFKPKKGIPTGGSLSVQIANIAVYYVLFDTLYSKTNLMQHIFAIRRFIDDGTGLFNGSLRQFTVWKNEFTKALRSYNLNIKPEDWQIGTEPGRLVHFLDISFGFDFDGELSTDIYIKETDSRSYLNFKSCHPRFIFSSVIYSQALRYRRIIINQDLLNIRLMELYRNFRLSDYPHTMINNILEKVKELPRTLTHNQQTEQTNEKVVRLISTYGQNHLLHQLEKTITPTLVEANIITKFEHVNKTAPSLKSMLSNSKFISLKNKYGNSIPCNRNNCKNCKMMSGKCYIRNSSNKKFKTAPGNCTSRNIIYAGTCSICNKNYVGRSTQMHASRNNGHRAKFVRYAKQLENGVKVDLNDLDDDYSLGIHLHEAHNITCQDGFNDNYKFTILENCNPRDLCKKEHLWIQKMRSLIPHGLNRNSPYGLPLLMD